MKENFKGKRKIVIVLKIMAVIMGMLSIFNLYMANRYIDGLVGQGFKISSQLPEVINSYVTTIAPYVFYGLVLFALAIIIENRSTRLIEDRNINKLDERDKIQETDVVDELLSEI